VDTKLVKNISHLYIYFQEKAEVIQDTLWVRLGVHLKNVKNASPWWKAAAILVSFGACVLPSIE
jgi:hypothetical protein